MHLFSLACRLSQLSVINSHAVTIGKSSGNVLYLDKTLSSVQGHVTLMDPSYSQASGCLLPEGSKGESRKVSSDHEPATF